ncbi:hypothetical protein WJX81_004116 [Elliptochloris bilobata]|uniref:S1 motif domain-containing protein n=1 Tax=Elliptochloris bilobata TaxID=381761 RepID=A0AAW1SKT3_9CHLO
MAAVVCPGDRLHPVATHRAGSGTYVHQQHIHASLVGVSHLQPPEPGSDDQRPVVSVARSGAQPVLPQLGDLVTCKVTKVNPRLASADILCVGNRPLDASFTGIIRLQDVRATEADKVEIYSSFRPGDLVRAEVVSLGDSRSYFLSTARNELGVVYAKSAAGVQMVPISWQEMQCPQSKLVEKRKVAKTA